jgi:hypothetical protein
MVLIHPQTQHFICKQFLHYLAAADYVGFTYKWRTVFSVVTAPFVNTDNTMECIALQKIN